MRCHGCFSECPCAFDGLIGSHDTRLGCPAAEGIFAVDITILIMGVYLIAVKVSCFCRKRLFIDISPIVNRFLYIFSDFLPVRIVQLLAVFQAAPLVSQLPGLYRYIRFGPVTGYNDVFISHHAVARIAPVAHGVGCIHIAILVMGIDHHALS